MPRLAWGVLFVFHCDGARITPDSEPLDLDQDQDPWEAWAEENMDPRSGELFHQRIEPSAMMEEEEEPSAMMEEEEEQSGPGALVIAAGSMFEPGSRRMMNNILFLRRRRARQSDHIEGPTPGCYDKPECAKMIEDGTLNCTEAVARGDPRFFTPRMDCPIHCNTTLYAQTHCIEETSPCSVEILPCEYGFRPRTECVRNFTYRGDTHSGCMHSHNRVWCPHEQQASKRRRKSSTCDECHESPADDVWEPVTKKLRCIEVAMIAGDATERKYTFENRGKHVDAQQPFASGGKFLAAVSLAAAVHRGFLQWDTLASDVFDWWTKDSSDPRSRVTFRHFMNFVDGFSIQNSLSDFTHNGFQERCLTYGVAKLWTPVSCAKQIYKNARHVGEPGRHFDYNSYHLQLAFGMVVQASGMEAREWLKSSLLDPVGMRHTYWMGGSNPLLSSGIMSTPSDHAKFLRKYLAYEILPKEIIDVVETESLIANDVSQEFNSLPFRNWAMGHWINYENGCRSMGGMVRECVDREAGTYIGAYFPLDSYGPHINAEGYAINWVKDDIKTIIDGKRGI